MAGSCEPLPKLPEFLKIQDNSPVRAPGKIFPEVIFLLDAGDTRR
jgi:hypothetical protein